MSATPTSSPTKAQALQRIADLRDALVRDGSQGRYCSAAAREWALLPMHWRAALHLIGDVGGREGDVLALAARAWREIPPPERDGLRFAIRDAKRHLQPLLALAARI